MREFRLVRQAIRHDAGRQEHYGGHDGPALTGSLLEVKALRISIPYRKAREPAYHVPARATILKLGEISLEPQLAIMANTNLRPEPNKESTDQRTY